MNKYDAGLMTVIWNTILQSGRNQRITTIGRMYSSEGAKIIKLFTQFY